MRLTSGSTEDKNKKIAEFSKWVLDVGDGTLPNIHPDDMVLTHTYLSQDSLCDNSGHDNDFGSVFPVEYLISINMPYLPRHDLKIKVGYVGTIHTIPRIEMVPTDTNWPFEFKRVQFPVQPCFSMTIKKSQGQSLNKVGLYLSRSVFTHGQLFVVVSRVTSPSGLHLLIDSETGGSTNVTANVIFEEVFYNLPVNEHT
ncbi:uncharacterized protein LOC141714712 [Apium graveolens]|uniref:uncharacterized protein LOC141714712 n=1 Tax=Apium graveolens TaxID=4045 RepID=UPI003D78CBAF